MFFLHTVIFLDILFIVKHMSQIPNMDMYHMSHIIEVTRKTAVPQKIDDFDANS
jgi:hypothetical protein